MPLYRTLNVVASYKTRSDIEHLQYDDCEEALCGRNTNGWMTLHPADLRIQLTSPYTCKRCLKAL